MSLWYVCDGHVKEYSGQVANWDNEVIVRADEQEEAIQKVLLYYRRKLQCQTMLHNGNFITAIP